MGFFTDLLSRVLDESSKASPDDRSRTRSVGGSPKAGGGLTTYRADRRTFKEVQSDIGNIKKRAAEEQRLLDNYDQMGIKALIGKPSSVHSRSEFEQRAEVTPDILPTATPRPKRKVPRVLSLVAHGQTEIKWREGRNFRNEAARFVHNPRESLGLNEDEEWVIRRESNFQPDLMNIRTVDGNRNFGLGQMSIGNRRLYAKKFGFDPDTIDPREQVTMVRGYIEDRYGTASIARKFWEITESGDLSRVRELPQRNRASATTFIEHGWIGY